jgi:hypothetical protein
MDENGISYFGSMRLLIDSTDASKQVEEAAVGRRRMRRMLRNPALERSAKQRSRCFVPVRSLCR